ncbi:hypothetical protein Pcinc_039279 [Petrolisthes cinctipes]|uniref:Uncharacterized protein n=1 Tax=Petrolisthes cinctipes TaxID=88211 RepID=A0AAE1BPP8_PETCI|nr:hypothetical protein Pcinc_039279 [Petrolisthes cinctipes]
MMTYHNDEDDPLFLQSHTNTEEQALDDPSAAPSTLVADDPAPEPVVVVVADDDAVIACGAGDEADSVPVSIPPSTTTRSEEDLEE